MLEVPTLVPAVALNTALEGIVPLSCAESETSSTIWIWVRWVIFESLVVLSLFSISTALIFIFPTCVQEVAFALSALFLNVICPLSVIALWFTKS